MRAFYIQEAYLESQDIPRLDPKSNKTRVLCLLFSTLSQLPGSMTAILFANLIDAAPFVKQYQRGRFEGIHEGDTVQDDKITLTITGSGKIKSTLRTERLLNVERVEKIIHPGSCSSLNEDFAVGSLLGISQVYEGDRVELSSPTYPRMPLEVPFEGLRKATLVTQDHTFTQESEQSYWQRIADLRDNTSYAIAYVSATRGIPCHILKIVTAIQKDQDAHASNTEEFMSNLAQYLISTF